MNFTIDKTQIPRLKIFNDYLKKLELISPLEQSQLFYVNKGKLSIYGYGSGSLGAGNIEAFFDINSEDTFYFSENVTQFIVLLEKTKSDTITVSVTDQSKLIIKGDKSKSVFTQVVLNTSQEDFDSIVKAVSDYEKSNFYKNSIDINVSKSKDVLSRLASMSSILKDVDTFKSYDDSGTYWQYFDIALQGIKLYFAQPEVDYETPSEGDIADMTDENPIKLTVSAADFFNSIDEFDGMFDSQSWQYKQIKFKTPKEFTESDKNIKLHFDNMVTCVDTELPIVSCYDRSPKKEFEMLLPTIHMKYIEDELKAEEVIVMKYSEDEKKKIVSFKNAKMEILITKMDS